MTEPPLVHFLIGGTQKSGTTALAQYLAAHPQVVLPAGKEAHVFDAPDFPSQPDVAALNQRFAPHFASAPVDALIGDATPITLFHPRLVERVHAYNPAMRWIILLRDPVERAISQHRMIQRMGAERRSLFWAVLLERWRLCGQWENWRVGAPLRLQTYVARSRYCQQLDHLYTRFPREQVLLLRSRELLARPEEVVQRVLAFLGLPPLPGPQSFAPVFAGDYHPPSRWSPGVLLLRLLLWPEYGRLLRRHGIDLDAP